MYSFRRFIEGVALTSHFLYRTFLSSREFLTFNFQSHQAIDFSGLLFSVCLLAMRETGFGDVDGIYARGGGEIGGFENVYTVTEVTRITTPSVISSHANTMLIYS